MRIILSCLLIGSLGVAAPSASAGSVEWSIGISSRSHRPHYEANYSSYGCDSRSVQRYRPVRHRQVRQSATTYYAPVRPIRSSCPPSGYWETVHHRVWVEGYWKLHRQPCGTVHRHWVPGYHKTVREQVWVGR